MPTSTNSEIENGCTMPPEAIVCAGASGTQFAPNEPFSSSPSACTPMIAVAPACSSSSISGGAITLATRCRP